MIAATSFEQSIAPLLDVPPYSLPNEERRRALLPIFQLQIDFACAAHAGYANYVRHWPVDFRLATTIEELPYLPVSALKADPPLSLVPTVDVHRTLLSSSTSGQRPSRVVLDAATSRRMTRSVASIIRDFIGPARRPYLVVDTLTNLGHDSALSARAAAIQALLPFATETVCCLRQRPDEEASLDIDALIAFAERWRDAEILVYGFTYLIWTSLVESLRQRGVSFAMPGVRVLHSGGWKRLTRLSVSKQDFSKGVASIFGCAPERVIDYYGMIENVGVIYPDCEFGHKHVPAFADVIVRDPLSLAPAAPGQPGLLQVCSILPGSFPGFLLLTEDIAQIVAEDGCPCGRRGPHFLYLHRAPRAELRGCGDVSASRQSFDLESHVHA